MLRKMTHSLILTYGYTKFVLGMIPVVYLQIVAINGAVRKSGWTVYIN